MRRAIAGVLCAISLCLPARAESTGLSPFARQVRTLLMLQDMAAAGNASAPPLEKKVITDILNMADAGQGPNPDDERDARAVIEFTLSGGPPRLAERMLQTGKPAALWVRLMTAAIAFKSGDADKAATQMKGIETAQLPVTLAGRLALMQAMLLPDSEAGPRADLLARASALMPGTLVDDAAQRRAALGAAAANDFPRAWRLARRYLTRLRGSLYARAFVTQFMGQIVALASAGKTVDLEQLDVMVGLLDRQAMVDTFLGLAEAATAHGIETLANFAAARAARLAAKGAPEEQRATLYRNIWNVVGDNYDVASAALGKLDPRPLTVNEQRLQAAAVDLARQIRAPAADQPALADKTHVLTPAQDQLATRAKATLARADSLLSGLSNP